MILGCIADDFTGASDAASFLVQGGMRTLLFNGIPEQVDLQEIDQADAIVVALKTRTQEKMAAIKDSLLAIQWLQHLGARQFYVKYCSTFDSTAVGNIGPICDAVMEYLDVPETILCPSLPINGRTVQQGMIYVNGVPLAESHMKDHPLTPMHESFIPALMKPQSQYECLVMTRERMDHPAAWTGAVGLSLHRYLVPDYTTDQDAEKIVEQFGNLPLLTGGSGILTAWARNLCPSGAAGLAEMPGVTGAGLLLAGSCSKATLRQIDWFRHQGGLTLKLEPEAIRTGRQKATDIQQFLEEHLEDDVLMYSSETPAYLTAIRGPLLQEYAALLEQWMADIAVFSRQQGRNRIIVAGGETSGAVTKALDYQSYWIGPSIAPGVPVMMPCRQPELRLVLKSGNFGQEDFFGRALMMTKVEC